MPHLTRVVLAAILLAGCAFDVVHVEQRATLFDAAPTGTPFEVIEDVTVPVGPGFFRTLRKGTRWMPAGRIGEGDVYRGRDQVLTVEASNIHEAWLVVRQNKVVGYYLLVEKSFSPLSNPVDLPSRPIL